MSWTALVLLDHPTASSGRPDPFSNDAARRHFQLYNAAGLESHQLVLHSPDPVPVKDPAELYQRDGGRMLGQLLSLGEDNPTLAAQIISATVFENAPRIRENILIAHAAADQFGAMIGTMPVEQWEDHVRLAADLIAQTHPSDPGYRHELVDQILDAAAAQAVHWTPPKPEDPAMTPTPAPRTDWAALNARMAALRNTTPPPVVQQQPVVVQEPVVVRQEVVQEQPARDTTNLQGVADAEKPVLTAMERLQRMRQNLHEQAQTTEQTWQDVRDQMPLEDTTIDQDRSITD